MNKPHDVASLLVSVCTAMMLASWPPCVAQQQVEHSGDNAMPANVYAIYELEPKPVLEEVDADRITRTFGLESSQPEDNDHPYIKTYKDHTTVVRGAFDLAMGNLDIFPNLRDVTNPAPSQAEAIDQAKSWLRSIGFIEQLQLLGVTTFSRQEFRLQSPDDAQSIDAVQSVRFVRQLDHLLVFGPASILTVDVGNAGVMGASIRMRNIDMMHKRPVSIISVQQAIEQLRVLYANELEELQRQHYTIEIPAPTLIYYEQGLHFVQPVYRFVIQAEKAEGAFALNWIVPATSNSPELILNTPRSPFLTKASDGKKKATTSSCEKSPTLALRDTLDLGAYIIQNGLSGWSADGAAFLAGFETGNISAAKQSKIRPARSSQFCLDEVWMWEPDPPQPDRSKNFVGAVNFAVHEGHGNMWRTAAKDNWTKTIELENIAGYGNAGGSGETTNYILWKGCTVIPVPDDPYCAAYKSPAKPSDVWFKIFNGMRGTYGFRTEMYIDDRVGGPFGVSIGVGAPILSAWFQSLDTSQWGHSTGGGRNGCPFTQDPGMEYGAAVLVCGREQDSAYDTESLPAPQCLTIWWQRH